LAGKHDLAAGADAVVRHVHVHGVGFGEKLAGVAKEGCAGLREGGFAAAVALQKRGGRLRLKGHHMGADSGLRNVQPFGRRCETAAFGNGDEDLETAQGDGLHQHIAYTL
jgi:hypothetical protein